MGEREEVYWKAEFCGFSSKPRVPDKITVYESRLYVKRVLVKRLHCRNLDVENGL